MELRVLYCDYEAGSENWHIEKIPDNATFKQLIKYLEACFPKDCFGIDEVWFCFSGSTPVRLHSLVIRG